MCKVVEEEFRALLPAGMEMRSLEQGLHRAPEKLREALQAEIDSLDADEILLGYGFCGTGVVGLTSKRARLIIPRVDDCIAILLGSYERYRQEFDETPGTYWFSSGWIKDAQNPHKEYERTREKYDEETARWVATEMMKGYKRVALIDTGVCPLSQLRPYVRMFAGFFRLDYAELDGTSALLRELVSHEHCDARFVVVEPGQAVTAEMFLPSLATPNG